MLYITKTWYYIWHISIIRFIFINFDYDIIYSEYYGCDIDKLLPDLFILQNASIIKVTNYETIEVLVAFNENEINPELKGILYQIYINTKHMDVSRLGKYITKYAFKTAVL